MPTDPGRSLKILHVFRAPVGGLFRHVVDLVRGQAARGHRVGIIAGIANVLADANVNILDISQSVIREFFTMIMMVDLAGAAVSFHELSERLARKGAELSVRVEIQREEIFKAMHRI